MQKELIDPKNNWYVRRYDCLIVLPLGPTGCHLSSVKILHLILGVGSLLEGLGGGSGKK